MTAQEIRKAYLDFYKERGHAIIPRAQLVPFNDPSTLFTGSGMQPMISYLLGENHPEGKRLADSQVCLRAQDIEDVGDDKHTTIFEMLGNWSLGDYFKTEQIGWIAEFLFDIVGLDPGKVYISCYIGNEKYRIPRDEDAIKLWQAEFKKRDVESKVVELGAAENGDKLGMQGGRIFLYDGKENWWSRNGDEEGTLVGDPCGPDSEMFYDFGEEFHDEAKWGKAHPASDSPRFFEIGNNVFMGYKKVSEDEFEPLAAPNIDHGSGLERIAAASLNNPDVFQVSLMKPIIQKLEAISGKNYESHTESMRVITDHLRAATFLAVDGVKPSNKEQGYVMRRLLRRAIRFAFELGIEQNFLEQIVPVIADLYKDDFPEVAANRDEVIEILVREEKVFRQTLRKGLKEFEKMYPENSDKTINGEDVFKLYDTYGFPWELVIEEAFTRGIDVPEDWKAGFDNKMNEQRSRSQTATKGVFKGGLGGQTLQHRKYHTATHLMYQSLRQVLGDHVVQRGSNITEERLRFDFSQPEKVTPEQLKQVEDIVNEQIKKDLKVSFQEYPTPEAQAMGALGQFGDRYGETVKVYKMIADGEDKPFSFEICGGPHVDHTMQLAEDGKRFKIIKEEASSAGVRRIKAVLQ
jgi:alanyl-tRNA synthetase